ncbi:MAG TPA: hypothetical protein VJ916_02450 [Anaerovoracaceae bacterium]|nr:hypothetical protein [Anaerovoracaceae bacterium]
MTRKDHWESLAMKAWIKYHRTIRLDEMFKIDNAKLRGIINIMVL